MKVRTLLLVAPFFLLCSCSGPPEKSPDILRPSSVLHVQVGPSPRFLFDTSEGGALPELVARAWEYQRQQNLHLAADEAAAAVALTGRVPDVSIRQTWLTIPQGDTRDPLDPAFDMGDESVPPDFTLLLAASWARSYPALPCCSWPTPSGTVTWDI